MTTVQISDELLAAARCEAERRGVAVEVVVAEAVQRFVVGADLSSCSTSSDVRTQRHLMPCRSVTPS